MIQRWFWGTLLLLLTLVGMVLAWQRPVALPLQLGMDEGVHNDQPFVVGFNDPEVRDDTGERYRWTTRVSRLVFPVWPERAAVVSLHQNNGMPARVTLAAGSVDGLETGRMLHVFVPPTQQLSLTLTVDQPFQGAVGDPRELGAALQGGALRSLGGWAWPPWLPLLAWLMPVLAVLVAVWALGGSLREGLIIGSLTGLGAIAAVWFAPLRVALAAGAIVKMTLYGLGWIAIMAWLLPRFSIFADVPPQYRRWLILATAAVWALRLGGRMVPASMPGDIGYHRNRVLAALIGDVYRPSQHRGVPTPYPPILYVLLQPFTLTGFSIDWLLQLMAAMCDALGLPILFALVQRLTQRPRAALLSALLYGVFPAGFMTMAWSFDSHIFTQFAALCWCATLIFWWRRWTTWTLWWLLTGGLAVVLVGHFSFYINTTGMLGVLAVAGLVSWWRGWPDTRWTRHEALMFLGMLVVAQVLAWGLYYSAFWDMFLNQLQSIQSGGAQGINNRQPVPRSRLISETLELGFWYHFGLLPVLLAPLGWRTLWKRLEARPAAIVIAATWIISLGLGLLPIVTGVPVTTRWLMFSAWAIAAAAGVALERLWEAKPAPVGRWAVAVSTVAIAAFGFWVWLEAVVYRIRPPEPF